MVKGFTPNTHELLLICMYCTGPIILEVELGLTEQVRPGKVVIEGEIWEGVNIYVSHCLSYRLGYGHREAGHTDRVYCPNCCCCIWGGEVIMDELEEVWVCA